MTILRLSNKRILVTGGAGFIGSNLINFLIERNSDVIIIDNFLSSRRPKIDSSSLTILEGNVLDEKIFHGIKDIDYIFHFGSPSSIILFNKDPRKSIIETTIGCYNILTFAKHTGVKRLIIPSSGSVYGEAIPPHSENSTPRPRNLYAVSKLACEQMLQAFRDPPPTLFLRIFAGYGPNEDHKGAYASPITLFLNKILANEQPVVFGDGLQSRDFIYIDDIIRIMLRAMESNFCGIVNVGSGVTHSFNNVIKLINARLKKNISPQYIPKPSNYLENTLADITLMSKLFQISPLPLEKGLDAYCALLGV